MYRTKCRRNANLFVQVSFLFLIPLALAYGAGKQLTGVFAPAPTRALSQAEAQSKFVVPEGFQVRLFARSRKVEPGRNDVG